MLYFLRSLAYCWVSELSAALDGTYAADDGSRAISPAFPATRLSDARLVERFTILAAADRRSRGIIDVITEITPKTFVSNIVRTALRSAMRGNCDRSVPPMPALFTNTSSRA